MDLLGANRALTYVLPFALAALMACDGAGSGVCDEGSAMACAISAGSALPFEAIESTETRGDDHGSPSCVAPSGAADVAFAWTAPYAGFFDVSTEGSTFDTVLSIRRGACDGEELLCVDDVGTLRQAALTIELEACETIVIVVDGFSADDRGEVRLRISTRESVCDDGLDDDGDGLIDCDDTEDCRTAACIDDGTWPTAWAEFEDAVLAATNAHRAAGATCGTEVFAAAPPLEMDELVRLAARLHSQDMATQDFFEHTSLDGRTFEDRMSATGFSGAAPWGENIAAGTATPDGVVRGWMESPGHCANIMSPSYRVIGIGYAFDAGSTFGHYWTQDFAASH